MSIRDNLLFSVVIVTRNRGNKICDTLHSLQHLTFSNDLFELVVVDNGSSDNTQELVNTALENAWFPWVIIVEDVVGICSARNAGISASKGKWVIFLDDDALVVPNWLNAYKEALESRDGFHVMGGPAQLDKSIIKPWWWVPTLDAVMSCSTHGKYIAEYENHSHPYGLNMAIENQTLREMGGFWRGMDILVNSFADETELFIRIKKAGKKFLYVPSAMVVHSVNQDRLTWWNILQRSKMVGMSHALLDFLHSTNYHGAILYFLAQGMWRSIKWLSPAPVVCVLAKEIGYILFKREIRRNHLLEKIGRQQTNLVD